MACTFFGKLCPLRLLLQQLLLSTSARTMRSPGMPENMPPEEVHLRQHVTTSSMTHSHTGAPSLVAKHKWGHASKWIAAHAQGMHGELSLCMHLSNIASRIFCRRCRSCIRW